MRERQSAWKEFDDEEHVFVNDRLMKYGVIKDDATFSKTGKTLWAVIPIVVCIIIILIAVSLTRSFWIGLIVGIPCFLVALFLIRKFVFDENRRKKLLRENYLHKESGVSYFNNVLGATDEGEILYQQSDYGFTSAYLVTFNYGSLTESTQYAEKNFIDGALRPFIKGLYDNNFRFKIYDVNIREHLSKGTLNLIEQNKKMKANSFLTVASRFQTEFCAALEKNNNVEQRLYFQVFNDITNSVKDFKKVLQANIDATLNNAPQISAPRICDKEEINEFGKNYFNIASFDIDNLNRNVKDLDLGRYFIIDGFVDQNGLIHKPEELSFFPQNNEEVSKRFNLKELSEKRKKRRTAEKQMKQKQEIMEHQQKMKNNGHRIDVVSQNNRIKQQKTIDRKRKKQQEELAKKQRQAQNKQHLQQSRAKNFEELLQRQREKH